MARAKEFSFSRDRDLILWKETFWYNGLRAAGAGIFFAGVFLFSGDPIGDVLSAPFLFPLGYFLMLLPIGLMLAPFTSNRFVAIANAFLALMVTFGDPFVFAFNKFRPEWVPVDRPPFFSLKLISFVVFEE